MTPAKTPLLPPGPVSDALADLAATAVGQAHRDEPVLPRTGGPAGNARLTAWTGLVLLVGFAVEGVTLVAMHQLISVHILVGALLVPPVLLKTATTGWRIVRYYLSAPTYKAAGPPPLVLRLVGPLVIVFTVAALASGLWLVVTGPEGRRPTVTVVGFGISWLTVHQSFVIAWFVATTVHVLGRTVPALRIVTAGRFALRGVPDVAQRLTGTPRAPEVHGAGGRRVAGGGVRAAAVVLTLAIGLAGSLVVLRAASDWTTGDFRRPPFGVEDGDG